MTILTPEEIVRHATSAIFDRQLVANSFRSLLVEAMIDKVVHPEWTWCSADYAAWDFERSDGLRMEVKQSAARQSWLPNAKGYSAPRFDIRARLFRWEGAQRIEEHGRFADLYVFAYHARTDEKADHREAAQWEFYVVPTIALPPNKSIGLRAIQKLSNPVPLVSLRNALHKIRKEA